MAGFTFFCPDMCVHILYGERDTSDKSVLTIFSWSVRPMHLLISWLQSPSAVILEPQKIKSDTVSTVSPSISHEVMPNCDQSLVTHPIIFPTPKLSLYYTCFVVV